MKKFKETFEKMAVEYAKYVNRRIEKADKKAITNNRTAMLLMNEARSVNVIAVTLNRMNGSGGEN
jgi:hypothetical protein